MVVKVHPKSNAELTQRMIDAIQEQQLFFNDLDCYHWFFDFQVDGIWISSTAINNELTECTVDLYNPKLDLCGTIKIDEASVWYLEDHCETD